MADPVTPPVETNPDTLFDQAVEQLQTNVPGWEPADGNLDVWLMEAFSQIAAQVGETASDVLTDIFRYYGANVAQVAPIDSIAASGTVTLTLVADELDAPDEIPEGFTIGKEVDGALVLFETTEPTALAAAATTAPSVPVVAVEEGVGGNDLTGAITIVDSLVFVASGVFDAATSGGVDAEEDDVYLARLVEELRLLTPRPILPDHFSTLAKRIAEVDRATTLDGYDPGQNEIQTITGQAIRGMAAVYLRPDGAFAKNAMDKLRGAGQKSGPGAEGG